MSNKKSDYIRHNAVSIEFQKDESWSILSPVEQSIKAKIDTIGTPLNKWNIRINYGIKTGLNEAFIIDKATRDMLIAQDPKSAEIIRPILRGKDIKRYTYEFADMYLIASHNGYQDIDGNKIEPIDIDEYPSISAWMNSEAWNTRPDKGTAYERLNSRTDKGTTPYNLRDCAYLDDFNRQKIMYAETMRVHKGEGADRFPRFSIDDSSYYTDKTCFVMTGDQLKYILAIINSSLAKYIIKSNVAVLDKGGFLMQKIYVEQFPIPKTNHETITELEMLVDNAIDARTAKESTNDFEDKIDRIVYDMFGFTDEEVAVIESSL